MPERSKRLQRQHDKEIEGVLTCKPTLDPEELERMTNPDLRVLRTCQDVEAEKLQDRAHFVARVEHVCSHGPLEIAKLA